MTCHHKWTIRYEELSTKTLKYEITQMCALCHKQRRRQDLDYEPTLDTRRQPM